MCVCVCVSVCYSHCCTAGTNNPIKQLCSNKKKKRKKETLDPQIPFTLYFSLQIVPTELDWWHLKWESASVRIFREKHRRPLWLTTLRKSWFLAIKKGELGSNFYDHITTVKILDLVKKKKISSTCWDIVVYYILIPNSMILRPHNPLLVSL